MSDTVKIHEQTLTVGQAAALTRALEEQEPGPPGKPLPSHNEHRMCEVRDALRKYGFNVRVKRRKLKEAEKIYLNVKGKGGHIVWRDLVTPVIREKFPNSYLTSGAFYTRGEGGLVVTRMDLTIALW